MKFRQVDMAIQARWAIDEKVMIFLIELILNPPIAPIVADVITNKFIMIELERENIRINGAIFCQVRRISPWIQLINSITWGNQKWVGAIPDFTPRAIRIKLLKELILLKGENLKVEILAKIKMDEASACVRKYLIDASEIAGEERIKMIGIKDIKLISKANHEISHEDEEKTIEVLIIKIKIRRKW